MKKALSIICSIMILVMCMIPTQKVYANSLTVSGVPSSVISKPYLVHSLSSSYMGGKVLLLASGTHSPGFLLARSVASSQSL